MIWLVWFAFCTRLVAALLLWLAGLLVFATRLLVYVIRLTCCNNVILISILNA